MVSGTGLQSWMLRNIKQMTMEVHRICGDKYNDPQGQAYRMNVIKKLTQTHVLVDVTILYTSRESTKKSLRYLDPKRGNRIFFSRSVSTFYFTLPRLDPSMAMIFSYSPCLCTG